VVAEAIGALVAAEFSRNLGLKDIELEGDSLLVVKEIKEFGTQWSSYGQMVGDARVVLNNIRSWFIVHVKRDANAAAHKLAEEAERHADELIWMKEISICIFYIVTLEQSALSI
jgi:ribonuclease HI